ncbi:putative K domain-containing protein [Helianthus annuus]|uniref:K domain-containing protein n=1 Tax=Helianthus annuus TaxID=4232 RepID=A0A251TNX1_HELAN|nr:KH domain-containing protein HEN4 [Helianthus annuus]KAF5787874.1 putative K domain-containing protein [Helianthus annuus]
MDAHTPFANNKRPFDHTTVDRSDPHLTPSSSTKRRHHPLPSSPATPQSTINNPFRNPIKFSSNETVFRILCPASKTGGLIGKGGAIIRQFREETGARIRIDEPIPGADERVILIAAADSNPNPNSNHKSKNNVNSNDNDNNNNSKNEECEGEGLGGLSCEESVAQNALVRVFERILKVDEERSKMGKEEGENGEDNAADGSGGIPQGPVVCRLLAASHQIGSVLGRGGKIIEKIRQESGAQVRVMPKDQLPECAFPGDELIQMAGKFVAVKKALLSVSSCLQEAGNSGSNRPMGIAPHGYGGDHHHRMGMEEEIVFRLLCHADKVGSLIGKGGSIRRALQTETGASIKIADPSPDSDERVVVISARESLEQRHSPSQDAVMRVHGRIVEAGFESGAAIVARLLVHSRLIGCIWGKGGMIINELRRLTGASIHVFPREQVAKYGMPSDEVVQVIGSLQCVQDALFQITGRLRETFFPMKPYFPNGHMGPPYLEMPPPSFRPRHDPAYSPVGPFEPPPFSHGGDHFHPSYSHPYGNERPGYGPPFSRQSEPASNMHAGEISEYEGRVTKVNDPAARNESITVEMTIPQSLLASVYGENNSNLGHIKEMSGAKVAVTEGKAGIVLSGTYDETQTAQCLVHGFIRCEQHLTPVGL